MEKLPGKKKGETEMKLSTLHHLNRASSNAFQKLEPCAGKLACTVLRGRREGNLSPLPDRA